MVQLPHSGDSLRKRRRFFATLVLAAPFVVAQTADTGKDPVFATVPFDQWAAQGDHVDIPWKVKIQPAELDDAQRLVVTASIAVDGKQLANRPPGGDLLMLMQIEDSQGRLYQGHGALSLKDLNRAAREANVVFRHSAFVTPGEYEVTIAMVRTATGDHNFTHDKVKVAPLKSDPLPDSWMGLSSVAILGAEAGMEGWFHRGLTGHLHLPVQNRMPVRVELLVNLPRKVPRHGFIYNVCMMTLIPQLRVLSEMALRNGVINVTLLDKGHGRAIPVTRHGSVLDWDAIRTGLDQADPNVVDVHNFGARIVDQQFLAEEVRRRIADHSDDGDASVAEHPIQRRVIVILLGIHSEYLKRLQSKTNILDQIPERVYLIQNYPPLGEERFQQVPDGMDTVGLRQPGQCPPETLGNCVGAPMSPQPAPRGGAPWDARGQGDMSLQEVLSALKPRNFNVKSPFQFREALAAILDEISRM
jgi:hypothetical protein